MLPKKIQSASSEYEALVVDDDPSQRLLQKETLSSMGLSVHEANSGIDAIGLVKKNNYDVVLMDRNMPDMNGNEACKYIRHDLGKNLLPIIVVTGERDDDVLAESMLSGATDFICKPYSLAEYGARVMSAVRTKRMTDQLDSAEALMFALARMVEAKDSNTGEHCSRLQYLAEVFGAKLGLTDKEILALRRGGVLHDIGKLGIPDAILLKQGPLTENEWIVMRTHPQIGSSLCGSLSSMRSTIPIILHHHENWDGSGYPYGLKGEEIPYLARVFQVLDIYDALSNARPYKKAFSREQVVEIMKDESTQGKRDPELINAFVEIIENAPETLVLPANFHEDFGMHVYNEIIEIGMRPIKRTAA